MFEYFSESLYWTENNQIYNSFELWFKFLDLKSIKYKYLYNKL